MVEAYEANSSEHLRPETGDIQSRRRELPPSLEVVAHAFRLLHPANVSLRPIASNDIISTNARVSVDSDPANKRAAVEAALAAHQTSESKRATDTPNDYEVIPKVVGEIVDPRALAAYKAARAAVDEALAGEPVYNPNKEIIEDEMAA